jgi:hypothetical protein
MLIAAKGIDDSGNTLPHSVVEGTWNFKTIYADDKVFMENNWPDFHFTFQNVTEFIQFSSATRKSLIL